MSQAPATSAFTWTDAQASARALSPRSDLLQLLAGIVAACDAAVIVFSAAGAWLIRHGIGPFPMEAASITLLATALTFNTLRIADAYGARLTSSAVSQAGQAVRSWTVVFGVLVLLGYLTKTSSEVSRAWAVMWYVFALAGLGGVRFMAAGSVRTWMRRGRLARTVAIVDLGGGSGSLARRIRQSADGQAHLVGVFTPERTGERRNGLNDLVALSRLFRIDEVIVAVAGKGQDNVDAATVLRRLGTIPTNVRLCPELPMLAVAPLEARLLFGHAVLTMSHRPMTGWNRVAKRVEDLVLGSVATLLLLPLMAVVAVAIKLDSRGPVLFSQRRLGFNNNEITVYKFRSMTHGRPAEPGTPQATKNDARVTRIGRFLRRSSIDELPQLFNVLKGEMSMVGPRPHAIAHNEEYAALIDDYLGRHRVQPGITGWAQVNGFRGETDTLDKMQRRVEHDLAYIENWSLALDLRIIVLTALRSIFDRNAY